MPDDRNMIGKGGGIPNANTGLTKARRGGTVSTSSVWKNIKWTRNKLIATTIALGLPYLIGIILTWIAGMPVITYILIGVGTLVGFVCLVVSWIDSDEF